MSSDIKNFGFPRWGSYGRDKETEAVRMCDYTGCSERGDHPAPKSPGSSERWHFCRPHAAEYNQNWNFFEGMSAEETKQHMNDTSESSGAFAGARTFEWGGAMDSDGNSSAELAAYDVLEVDADSSPDLIKKQYRKLAKIYHPDANSGDPAAATRFHEVQTAYDILRKKHNF